MRDIILIIFLAIVVSLLGYSIIGTDTRVDKIKKEAPLKMNERNWRILRYEGYTYGSWGNHGGKVWYHVQDLDNPNIQYRIFVTMWNDELHWTYGEPEKLQRLNINYKNKYE